MPRSAKRLGIGSLAAIAVLYLVFAQTGAGSDIDQAALLDRGVSVEVDHVKLFDVGPVVVAIVLLGALAWWRLGPWLALAIAASIGASSALALALTRILPQVVEADPSFPSGDATLGMAIAVAMVLVATPADRGAMVPGAAALAIVVGVGLVALEWHRPAEVAAGYLLAVACACPVLAVPGFPSAGHGHRRHPVGTLALALTGLLLAFLAVRTLVFAIDHDDLGGWLAFAAGEVLIPVLAVYLLLRLRASVDEVASRL